MYSTICGIVPTIPPFIIQLFTIQRSIVLSFTIQEWTNFTPGRVYNCIVPYVVLSQLFNNLLYHYLLLIKYSWQSYIMYSGYCILVLTIPLFTVQEYVIQKCVIFTPGRVMLYKGMLYISSSLSRSWQGYIKIPC